MKGLHRCRTRHTIFPINFGPRTKDGNLEKNENLMKSRSHRIQVNHMKRIFTVIVLAVMCPLAHAQKAKND